MYTHPGCEFHSSAGFCRPSKFPGSELSTDAQLVVHRPMLHKSNWYWTFHNCNFFNTSRYDCFISRYAARSVTVLPIGFTGFEWRSRDWKWNRMTDSSSLFGWVVFLPPSSESPWSKEKVRGCFHSISTSVFQFNVIHQNETSNTTSYWYKLQKFKNLAGINFRDREKFWLNFLIFMRFLTIFFFIINISRLTSKVRFCGYKLSRTPKKFAKSN